MHLVTYRIFNGQVIYAALHIGGFVYLGMGKNNREAINEAFAVALHDHLNLN